MSETQNQPYVRYLGGESGHRSLFGASHSKARVTLMAIAIGVGMVITPSLGLPGLIIGLVGAVVAYLVTARTHRGTIAGRMRRRRRWKHRVRYGLDAYEPYDAGVWEQLEATAAAARSRVEKWNARRELNSMRANPDGADGMGWLQMSRGVPGIQWHAPLGEPNYLAVTFAVTGQLRGIESTSVMNRAAEGWGQFLAGRAAPNALVGGVQTMTRILPADTAMQEFWVVSNIDRQAPPDAVRSYAEVLQRTGDGAMVQRHYITVKWPIDEAFIDAASKHGDGREGWRRLMSEEINSVYRGLLEARMGDVSALSARQTAAVLLHQQNPSRPIDFVADVHPSRLGLRSYDEFSAHVVEGVDPVGNEPVEWWHRTAKITADALVTSGRNQLWMLELLVGRDLQFVRSISFHLHLVPAAEAKAAATTDLVRDQADALALSEKGAVDVDDTEVALTASMRRRADLRAGTGNHGASWVGYVTVSARDKDELARNCRQLQETCATGLGIDYLDWQDSFQGAASGTTWPIGRGLSATRVSVSARLFRVLAGKTEKEAIS